MIQPIRFALAFGALTCAAVSAQEASPEGGEVPEEAVVEEEESFWAPQAEVTLDFCSKQTTYGLVDNDQPVFMPAASIGAGPIAFEIAGIWDLSDYGRKAGYGNRRLKYQELTFGPTLSHQFGPVEASVNYTYEFHPHACTDMPDTQFVNLGLGLPDLFLRPALALEIDIDNEDGACYLDFTIGHTFTLLDDLLDFTLEGGIAGGNALRNRYDFDRGRTALKDARLVARFDLALGEHIALSPYLIVSTQVDRDNYDIVNEDGDPTLVYGGIALSASY